MQPDRCGPLMKPRASRRPQPQRGGACAGGGESGKVGSVGGFELWTTCFYHLGRILHDWAKCLGLDAHDSVRRARLDTNVHFFFFGKNCGKNLHLHFPPPPAPYTILHYVLSPIRYSIQTAQLTDRDWGFNEKQTDRGGNETLVAHTNCCNNHIYIKAR